MKPNVRSALSNEAIGAILQKESMDYINALSASLGYSSETVTVHNAHELLDPARLAFIGVHLAKKFYFEGMDNQAILWLQVALENGHPDEEVILHNMGVAYSRLKERIGYDLFMQEISPEKQAIAINPIPSHYETSTPRHSERITATQFLPQMSPIAKASSHYIIGGLQGKYGDWDAAIESFRVGREFALEELGLETHGTPLGETLLDKDSISSADDSGIFE